MKRAILIAGLLSAGLIATAALAGDDCTAPMSTWQPREAMEQKAISMGWTVDRIRTDDGCYKVYAHDASGKRIEAKFDPASLALIKLKDADHEDKQEESHDPPETEVPAQGSGN